MDQGFIFYAEYRLVGNDVTTTQQSQIFARRRAAESIKPSKTTTILSPKVSETRKRPTSEVLQKEANIDENGVYILDQEDFERIENRFKTRRELLTKACLSQGNTF